ncbi:MAG TPA: ABC transporter substrate-binding protein [Mycobacteriales bacterium]|nr:ABC transporter substrate-binding protein [Mycobacteriales bacterium]
MRPARSRSSRVALALGSTALLALTASGCAARFDRPPPGTQSLDQGGGLPVDQGGLPITPTGQPGTGTTGLTGTTSGTTGVQQGPSTTGGTTGGTTTTGGTAGGSTGTAGGGTTGSVPPGSTTGINGTTITVGLFVPKTGAAPVPATVDAQAQNYFDYVREKGGINGRNVKIKIYDTGSTEAGARTAVQQAVSDGIFAAVSLDRLTVEARLTAELHAAHIPHLVAQLPPSTTIPDDAFYIGMNQLHHGPQIADYMVHNLRKTKVGVIIETDPGLNAARDAFVTRAQANGATVYKNVINPADSDYTAQVNALCASKAETTWLYMAPTPAVNIAVEYRQLCPAQKMTWVGNNISWGFNLVLTPAAGALDGAKVFSPWGGLRDPRYTTFNQVNKEGQTDRDKDIGLAAWGFGQVLAAAIKQAGPALGRNSFLVAMQALKTGTTDQVTGTAMCWPPLDFTGGKRYGSGDRSIVMTVQGTGATAIWATESDYRSTF